MKSHSFRLFPKCHRNLRIADPGAVGAEICCACARFSQRVVGVASDPTALADGVEEPID